MPAVEDTDVDRTTLACAGDPQALCEIVPGQFQSANEEYVKAAVKTVRKEGHKFRVLVPFNKKEKPRVVREALKKGAKRIIAGGGDGTINAVANALIKYGGKNSDVTLGICPLGTAKRYIRILDGVTLIGVGSIAKAAAD